jgi:uncharacterized membrane protein YqiK
MSKGITGYQLTVIITIIIAVVIIALAWIFFKMSSEGALGLFEKFTSSFTSVICRLMGWWAKFIFGGMC